MIYRNTRDASYICSPKEELQTNIMINPPHTVFLLILLQITISTCPPTSVNSNTPELCTFSFSDSTGTCIFSSCKLTSGAISNDWKTCIQSCCNQMAVPNHQDLSAVQQCISFINQTKSSSSIDGGVKEIIIIVAINVGAIILMVIFIKVFGGSCCCNHQSCCYYEKLFRLCPRHGHYSTDRINVALGTIHSRESIANVSEPSKKKSPSTICMHKQIWQTWQTDEKAMQDHTCSICLEENSSVVLDCGHWFHRECIGTWTKLKKECPNCKRIGLKNAKVYCGTCRRSWQMKEKGPMQFMASICKPCSLSQM